jgi:hypothetical protein
MGIDGPADDDLLIWWTDAADLRRIGDPTSPPAGPLPAGAAYTRERYDALPEYIRREYRGRYGRGGRGRLWIPGELGPVKVPWTDGGHVESRVERHDCGGIVFRREDLGKLADLPGFFTRVDLVSVEPPWPDDPETFEGECECCHERRPLQRVHDPFVGEGIDDGPDEELAWCRPCYETRLGDV